MDMKIWIQKTGGTILYMKFSVLNYPHTKRLDYIEAGFSEGWHYGAETNIKESDFLNLKLFEYWFPKDSLFDIFFKEGNYYG